MQPEDLGPLPPHRHSLNSGAFLPLYTADQMRAERQRCYELGRAAEREQWDMLIGGARRIAEGNIKRADDCGMLSRALLDALKALRAKPDDDIRGAK